MAKSSAVKSSKRPRTQGRSTGSGTSRALVESMRAVLFDDPPAIDRAQDLVYEAWEAPSAKKRRELAEQALRISPDCADAYNILADLTTSPAEARALYDKAVAAGARALGEEFFEENVGHFWGLLETRPYMRARAGLAELLWDAGEREAAVDHYRELLRLNPGDNQGIRQILVEFSQDWAVAPITPDRKGQYWRIDPARAGPSFTSRSQTGNVTEKTVRR